MEGRKYVEAPLHRRFLASLADLALFLFVFLGIFAIFEAAFSASDWYKGVHQRTEALLSESLLFVQGEDGEWGAPTGAKDYLAYQEPVPSLSSYGISEVAFERLLMDQGLSLGSEYVELQRMSAAAFEKTPIFLANGEIPHANLNEENYDALFFPFTRIDTLALPARSKGKGYLAYRLHAYDGNGNTVDSPIVQDALAFSFAYENGKAQFTLIDANTLEEKEQNRELPYEGFYWPDDYIE